MNSDDTAITPDSFEMPTLNAEPIEATESIAVEVATQDDKELAALNMSRGWQRVESDIKADIELFRTGGFIKDIEKLPLEEVGKLFVIHQTVASMLQKYLTKVEDATKAVVENERNGK